MKKEDRYRQMNADRRQSILHAARGYFVQNGIGGVMMQDIAKAAGVSRQTLYLHFKNIEDVVFAVAGEVMRQSVAALAKAKTEGLAPLEAIRESIRLLFTLYNKSPDNAVFIVLFDIYNRASAPEAHGTKAYQEMVLHFPQMFEEIEAGMADGSIRADLDPELARFTLINAVVGAWQRLVIIGPKGHPADTLQNEKLTREIEEMALRYLRSG